MHQLSNTEKSIALKKLFNCLLESVSENGYWNDYDENWDPIITTITVELLIDSGLKLDDKWYIHRRQEYLPINLTMSLAYLDSKIRDDGSFGTDFWDTLRLGKLIVSKELRNYFHNYVKLHEFILNTFKKNKVFEKKTHWNGPAIYACAVDYFDITKNKLESEIALDKLISSQLEDGSWAGAPNKDGYISISPIWHTAQVINTLRHKNLKYLEDYIKRAYKWMINVQETDGSWPALEQFEIYYTSYAVWALEGTEYQENVQKATKYLYSKISETGKCIDLGGTLMCAIAFWSANKYDADKSISFMEYILAFKAIEATNQLENQILTLTAACKLKDDQIKRFKEKYKDTDLVISKRATLIITIASIIVTFIGIIAGVIALV